MHSDTYTGQPIRILYTSAQPVATAPTHIHSARKGAHQSIRHTATPSLSQGCNHAIWRGLIACLPC